MKDLERIGRELIPVIAVGDATGLPMETKSRQYIQENLGTIEGFNETSDNDYFEGVHGVGTWSDDTQLSIAVAEGLIAADGFDLDEQAIQHVIAYDESKRSSRKPDWPLGWGGSTVESVRRLAKGIDPTESGQADGAGNGVLMKMTPLVYWQTARGTDGVTAQQEVIDLTQMTHAAPEAVVSSLVHRKVLSLLLEPQIGPQNFPRIYRHAISFARRYEGDGESRVTSDTLRRLERFTLPGDPDYPPLTPERIVDAAPKRGFYAPETLLMAYGSFLLEHTYPQSVYRAVELGGDTDSIGSIVATMSLFAHGEVQHPADYEQLVERERLEDVSKKLAQAALKGAK